MAQNQPLRRLRPGSVCRDVTSALIAGVWRRMTIHDVRDRLAALPARDEAIVSGAVLAVLLLLALLAAQFGAIGILLYLLAVVLIVN